MKIESIQIQGIKSHQKTQIDLAEYSVIVGENNSGKSTILLAVLWFFGEQKINALQVSQRVEDVFVEIEFSGIAPDSGLASVAKERNATIRAGKKREKFDEKATGPEYFFKAQDGSYQVLKKLPDEFDLFYVPAVRSLTDELKLTATSSYNKLVQKVLASRIGKEGDKEDHFAKIMKAIKGLSDFMSEGDNGALKKMAEVIKANMLSYQGVELGFDFKSLSVDELIKNCLDPHTKIEGFDSKFPVSAQGDGFQRSLTFSLITSLAEQDSTSNRLALYLIEEPELFLHPNHQMYFRTKLVAMASKAGNQVLVTSHSPYFVSNVSDYSQIKRAYLKNRETIVSQLSKSDVENICAENGKLMADATNAVGPKNWDRKKLENEAKRIAEDDHLRYLLWIDPRRANAFLSGKVILVEGSTEKSFFSYLFDSSDSPFGADSRTADVAVVDVNGKYHMFKFIKLLNKLGIRVWCIHDTDNDKENFISHKVLNDNLKALEKSGELQGRLELNPELEAALGIEKHPHYPDIEIYKALASNQKNCKESKSFKAICSMVSDILKA
jgi:putative ATP-dependent endonuclease of the OLD family